MKRPIEHCYWVVPGKLLAGEYPGHEDDGLARKQVAALRQAGIDVFIDLTEEKERFTDLRPYARLAAPARHRRFPIRDWDIPASPERTAATLDAIDRHMAQDEAVYVHCWGGIGRTGVIVGCWLARHFGPGQSALARLQSLWRHNPKSASARSPQTDEQLRYVLNWREGPRKDAKPWVPWGDRARCGG